MSAPKDTRSLVPSPCGKLATRSASLASRGLGLLRQINARAGRHRGLGWTSLHIAALGDHRREAELLLEQGADANARDKFGHTPIFFARSAYMAQVLVSHGADINARRSDGATALHRVARIGCRQVATILLRAGADRNASQDGTTPLHVAARRGHWAVAELLLSHGANPNLRDSTGSTPLALAEESGHEGVAQLLRRQGRGTAGGGRNR